jgi:hypothetical protein
LSVVLLEFLKTCGKRVIIPKVTKANKVTHGRGIKILSEYLLELSNKYSEEFHAPRAS